MFVYVLMNLKKLVFKEENSYSTQQGLLEYDKLPPIKFDETDMVIFHTLKKQSMPDDELDIESEDFRQYIDMWYSQSEDDWYKPADKGRYTRKRVESKRC